MGGNVTGLSGNDHLINYNCLLVERKKKSADAKKFYEKVGFVKVGKVEDRVLMKKDLDTHR